MIFGVDSKPSLRAAAAAARPTGAFGQRYPINVGAKGTSTAVAEVRPCQNTAARRCLTFVRYCLVRMARHMAQQRQV